MQKWEYCLVYWRTLEVDKASLDDFKREMDQNKLKVRFEDMKSDDSKVLGIVGVTQRCVPGSKPEQFDELPVKIGELGNEGWEMVSHTESTDDRSQVFYFKRAAVDESVGPARNLQ